MRITLALMLIILAFAFSCKDNPGTGPREIYYGEDICERCKMIISEEAFSAQYILSGGQVRKFDDLGCMLLYTSEGEGGEDEREDITAYYVKDYTSGEWIDGGSAYYIWSQSIKTPMGHGIVAIKGEGAARELAERENGRYLGGFNEAREFILEEGKK